VLADVPKVPPFGLNVGFATSGAFNSMTISVVTLLVMLHVLVDQFPVRSALLARTSPVLAITVALVGVHVCPEVDEPMNSNASLLSVGLADMVSAE
jgi:hypothetical protein